MLYEGFMIKEKLFFVGWMVMLKVIMLKLSMKWLRILLLKNKRDLSYWELKIRVGGVFWRVMWNVLGD